MGVAFFVIALIVVVLLIVVYLAGPVLFTVLTIVFRKKKPARITFIVLAAVSFIPAAALICGIIENIVGLEHYLIFSIFAMVLFLILAIALRKEKSICTWFTVLTAVNFMFVACLTYDFVKNDMADSGVNISSQTELEAAARERDIQSVEKTIEKVDKVKAIISGSDNEMPEAYYCRGVKVY
ncbi:MAG: hypothetical protein K2K57_12000 [Oscillospiraceae bacterium]|nr:hypothetical protein [Oscillospiraceae bacterium]